MIYYISGLGADHRVFEFLNIPFPYKHIIWVKPDKNDTLASYSLRLLPQINTSEDVILAGVSFGGMICQEIAKLIPCSKVIIISSIKSPQEMHWQLKLVRNTRIDRLFHSSLLKFMNFLTGPYYFGTQSAEEIKLLKAIIKDTDKKIYEVGYQCHNEMGKPRSLL
ncbi:MAG: alpha/beta hydrolase [Bacteroidales bacterium]|nr:alpha/beta hydrolase [Bacteroidales bacterium]